jgi:sugar phosphate isomerase/epimerase
LTRETAERLGLRIEAVITHQELSRSLVDTSAPPLDLEGTIDLAIEVGAEVVTFHMGGYPADIGQDTFWQAIVDYLRSASDYAAARHIVLAVDGIWPVWIDDSPDTLERLFDAVGSPVFGVNFDPCYLVLMGVDPAAFARRFAKRIVHAHLKDHRGRYPKWTHVIPGRGEMDYAKVVAALSANRFAGSCAVECFTDMPFREACDDGYRALMTAAEKSKARFVGSRRATQAAGLDLVPAR